MPRQQRYRLPGVPQHVIQRGNNRQVTFFYNLEKAWEQGNPAAVEGLVLNYREMPSSSVAAPGRGNLIRQSHTNGTVLYGYDSANRMISMTYPSGRRVSTTYDVLGRISRISTTDVTGNTQILANAMTYQAFGPRTGMTYGNGLILTRNFDQDGRLTAQEIKGTATIQSLQFAYNAAGNLINKTNLADATRSQTYGYDNLDRLTSAQGVYGNIGYSYDAVGNRLTRSQGAVNDTYGYSGTSNRIVSVDDGTGQTAYQFDANGNTTAKGAERFVYNPENRLTEYHGNTTATYVYNAKGQRMQKNTVTATVRYVYNRQGQLIGEYNGGSIKEYVYLDGEPLAIIDNNTIYYTHNDYLATPQQMTDQSQTVVWAADYKPFGEVTTTTSTVENNLRFPGQYYDQESRLHYNYYRDYDPSLGRYRESDPIGLIGGINNFVYVDSNTISLIDPNGLNKCRQTSRGLRCGPKPNSKILGGSVGVSLMGMGGTGGGSATFGVIRTKDNFCFYQSYCVFVGGGFAAGVGFEGSASGSTSKLCNGRYRSVGAFYAQGGGFIGGGAVSASNTGTDVDGGVAFGGIGGGAAGGVKVCETEIFSCNKPCDTGNCK